MPIRSVELERFREAVEVAAGQPATAAGKPETPGPCELDRVALADQTPGDRRETADQAA